MNNHTLSSNASPSARTSDPTLPSTVDQALELLGVRDDTLTPAEKASLDRDGYLFLEGIVQPRQIERMLAEITRLFELERTGQEGAKGECEQIQNKSDAFDVCFTHPRVLAAIRRVLGPDMVFQGVHSRPNPPGKGSPQLHQDTELGEGGRFLGCNSMWPLTNFTAENGATRVVPGSHRWGPANSRITDPCAPYPGDMQLIAPAGSVVVFNASLWHSVMPNRSRADRPNVTGFWGVISSSLPYKAGPNEETRRRISPAARRLLHHES